MDLSNLLSDLPKLDFSYPKIDNVVNTDAIQAVIQSNRQNLTAVSLEEQLAPIVQNTEATIAELKENNEQLRNNYEQLQKLYETKQQEIKDTKEELERSKKELKKSKNLNIFMAFIAVLSLLATIIIPFVTK